MTSDVDPSTQPAAVEETRSASPAPAVDGTAHSQAASVEPQDVNPLTSIADPPPPPSIDQEQVDSNAVDDPSDATLTSELKTPKASITLLLVSGRRRTLEFEPKTTIGELKEVVWSTWPSDWSDELPPSAAFLRILYLGRILTDETTLSSMNLHPPPEPTVVHVSVRSFATTASDEDLKKKQKKRGSRRGRGSGADAPAGTGGVARGTAEPSNAGGGCCGCIIV